MKNIKSERLKKLEGELNDLEQWMKLGLVPKKDLEKHKEEIKAVRSKIEEEKERLRFLKENGEGDEYISPKKGAPRPGYAEMPTLPDIEFGETGGFNDSAFESETEVTDVETSAAGEEKDEKDLEEAEDSAEEEEESPFSDRNRWRRGGIIDPDADEW